MSYFFSLNPVFSSEPIYRLEWLFKKGIDSPSKIHRLFQRNTGFTPFIPAAAGCKLWVDERLLIKKKILKERLEKVLREKDNGNWTLHRHRGSPQVPHSWLT